MFEGDLNHYTDLANAINNQTPRDKHLQSYLDGTLHATELPRVEILFKEAMVLVCYDKVTTKRLREARS